MFCCHPRRTSDESFRRFAWRLIHSMDFTEQNLELFQKKWEGLQKIGWIDHFEFGVVINMLMLLHGRAGNREAVSRLESVLATRNLESCGGQASDLSEFWFTAPTTSSSKLLLPHSE